MRYRFECTCPGCPEQYDVWDGDTKVAYVRYRWGYLRVNPYKPEKFEVTNEFTGKKTVEQEIDRNIIIFDKEFGDNWSGCFPDDKRDAILAKIDKEIVKYYNLPSEERQLKEWYDED